MSSPVSGNGPLDVTQFNSDLVGSSPSELNPWYGAYQTFYPGASVSAFEQAMLAFANASLEAYGVFDPTNPTVFKQFLGAAAATTGGVDPSLTNQVTNNFRDSDTNAPTPTPSQLLANWVAVYKQYHPGDTTSLADIEQGTDLQFDESLGSFIQTAQTSGTSYAPADDTFNQYQGQTVLSTFTSGEVASWQAAFKLYNPDASQAEFEAFVGQFASQQGFPVTPSMLQAFQNAALDSALYPPVATWQAAYLKYFPGSSTASFQAFLNTFVNGLPTQLTVSSSSQFFAQFEGYVVADSAAFQASGTFGASGGFQSGKTRAQVWQGVYEQYHSLDTSTNPLTDAAFLDFLGQFQSRQGGPLDPVSSLSQFQGAVAASSLNSTQESILQALYTGANPGASTATYLSYLGGLLNGVQPPPTTPDAIAGLVTYNILFANNLLAAWQAVYQKYFPGSSVEQFQNFLGNFVLTQPTAINPNNSFLTGGAVNPNGSLSQFAGATVLSYFPSSSVAQWQACYQNYYPDGALAQFQTLVGQLEEGSSTPLDPVTDFPGFQNVVLDSSLVPVLATWQAFYVDSLGLDPNNFQADVNAFAATQPAPMDPVTSFTGFINYLFGAYSSNLNVIALNNTWQTAYNENFQQGSVPEPFTAALARFVSFQQGAIDPSDSTSFINWTNSMSKVDFTSWETFYNEIYAPGTPSVSFQDFLTDFITSQLPTSTTTTDPLTPSNPLQLFNQFQGAVLLADPALAASFAADQTLYDAYHPGTTLVEFETFLGQAATQLLAVQQDAIESGSITAQQVLTNDLTQLKGIVIESSLTSTQAALLQRLYTNSNPNALSGDFQTYLGGLTLPVPATPAQIAGAEASNILTQAGQLASWTSAYNAYSSSLPSGTTFASFLGNFTLAQPLPFNPTGSLTQFSGALALGILPAAGSNISSQASWQAAYTQYYPNGTTADFQTFVGQFASTQQGGVISANSIPSLATFQNAVLDSVLTPPLVTWQSVYVNLGLPPAGSSATFQSDLNDFVAAQTQPLNPMTEYQAFISYLLTKYGPNSATPSPAVVVLEDTWQKAYNQNFQQGSIPTPFPYDIARFLAFQYQVNAGGIEDAAVVAGQQAVNSFSPADLTAWEDVYFQFNPGAVLNQFYNFVGLFAALQPSGQITPSLLPQFTIQVASGQGTRGALVAPAAVEAGRYALGLLSQTDISTWHSFYNSYNPGADLDEFYGFAGVLASVIPVGPAKQPNGQLIPSVAFPEFQAQVANTAFVSWTNSMSQVDFNRYQDVYLELFPQNTALQFQTFLLNYTSTLPVPLSPENPQALYDRFVGTALVDGGTTPPSPPTTYSTIFEPFYDQYNPGATTDQFETFLGQFANVLLLKNQAAIQNGAVVASTLLADSYPQFQKAVIDKAFVTTLNDYQVAVKVAQAQGNSIPNFIFPPSGTANVVPSDYESWYTVYQKMVPNSSIADFQTALNAFITTEVPQGVTIDATQSLPLFVGVELSASFPKVFRLDSAGKSALAITLGNYLKNGINALPVPPNNDPFPLQNVLNFPGFGTFFEDLEQSMTVTSDRIYIDTTLYPWTLIPTLGISPPIPFYFSYTSSGQITCSLPILDNLGNVIIPAGSAITDPALDPIIGSNSTLITSIWQNAYNLNTAGATQNKFLSALGSFLLGRYGQTSAGDVNLGRTATTGFNGNQLVMFNEWWNYFKQYNLADDSTSPQTDTQFLAYVGQLASQLNVTTIDPLSLANFAAFKDLVSSVAFVDWNNSVSKVDFSSWQTIYSQLFPSKTADDFENFFLTFASTLPAPISPADPTKFFNQFVGAALLYNGITGSTPTTYAAFQTFYKQYNSGATTADFEAYLGQFANQLLFNNKVGIQNGSVDPSTLLANSLTSFQQNVVDNAFTTALNAYQLAVKAAQGQGNLPPAFSFPPSGTVSLVPSAYASWYEDYKKMIPNASLSDFQTAFNKFITNEASQGVTIDPAETLPLFVGAVLSLEDGLALNLNNVSDSTFKTDLINYLVNINVAIPGGGIFPASGFYAASQGVDPPGSSTKSLPNTMTVTRSGGQITGINIDTTQPHPWGSIAPVPPPFTFTVNSNGQLTCSLDITDSSGNVLTSAGTPISDSNFSTAFSNLLHAITVVKANFAPWQTAYNQNNAGATQNQFAAALGNYAIQQSLLGNSIDPTDANSAVNPTSSKDFVSWAGNTSKVDFSSWEALYKEIFPSNTSVQFQAFLNDFTSQLPAPISPSNPLQFFNQFLGAALLYDGKAGGTPSTAYADVQTFYDQYNNITGTPTTAQTADFEAYLGRYANQLLSINQTGIRDGTVLPASLLNSAFLQPSQVAAESGSALLAVESAGHQALSSFSQADVTNWQNVYNQYNQYILQPQFPIDVERFYNVVGLFSALYPNVTPSLLPQFTAFMQQQLQPPFSSFSQQVVNDTFAAALDRYKESVKVAQMHLATIPDFVFPPSGTTATFVPADYATWYAAYQQIFPSATLANFQGALNSFIKTELSERKTIDPTQALPLFVGRLISEQIGGFNLADISQIRNAIANFFSTVSVEAPGQSFFFETFQVPLNDLLNSISVVSSTEIVVDPSVWGSNWPPFSMFLTSNGQLTTDAVFNDQNLNPVPPPTISESYLSGFSLWEDAYNQNNKGATQDQYLSALGSYALQQAALGRSINPTDANSPVNPSSASNFVAWAGGSSKIDFSSWQTLYSTLFPSGDFQAFLNNFTSQLPVPISPSNPLQFFNQFVGAMLLENGTVGGSPTTYAAFQTFYDQYNGITGTPTTAQTAQFEAYLGQYANQLLAANQAGIQKGTINPSTLLASSLTQPDFSTQPNTRPLSFEQQVVDDSFTAALNSYSGSGTFNFPPSGTVALVPSAFASWYTNYQKVIPGASIADFQATLNQFITAEVPLGVTIDPTATLPLFVGGGMFASRREFKTDSASSSAIKIAFTNYLESVSIPTTNGGYLLPPGLSDLVNSTGIPLMNSMTLTPTGVQVNTTVPPWSSLSSGVNPFSFSLGPSGQITCSLNILDISGNVLVPIGTSITDSTLTSAISGQLTSRSQSTQYISWQTLYDQYKLGWTTTPTPAQVNEFSSALGTFLLNHNSQPPVGTGNASVIDANTIAGNKAVAVLGANLSTWLSAYQTYNPADTSTVAQPSQQFLAFLGQFYSSLSSSQLTTFSSTPANFLPLFQSQVMSISYQATGLKVLSGFSTDQTSQWWDYYRQYNLADTSTSAQTDPVFLAFVGQFAAQKQAAGIVIDGTYLSDFQKQIDTINFTDWSNSVLGVPPTSIIPSITLSAAATHRRHQALILNNLFKVLNSMIGAIQQAVTTVGGRLTFYANYQQEVTSEISAMPIYTVSGPAGNPLVTPGGADVNTQNKYAQYQSSANSIVQARQATLRALRDSVGSLTQQLQTTITQLNDASTNQGSIGTSILQTLSSILTLIFR